MESFKKGKKEAEISVAIEMLKDNRSIENNKIHWINRGRNQ